VKLPPEGEQLIDEIENADADKAWASREPYRSRVLWLASAFREMGERIGKVLEVLGPHQRVSMGQFRRLVESLAPSKRKWRFHRLDLVVDHARRIEWRMEHRGIEQVKGELTPELVAAELDLRIKYGKDEEWEGEESEEWQDERRELADQVRKKLRNPSGTSGGDRWKRDPQYKEKERERRRRKTKRAS
jgi:hypothetical protein